MGIILGLLSAFCWGSADMFARSATRRIGTFATLLYIQFIGFVVLGVVLVANGELAHHLATATPLAWALALLTGALNMVSQMALYRSFEVCRTMALVSPIAATYAAITVILAIIAGELLTASRGVGILLALLGVMLAAIDLRGGINARRPGEGPLGGGVGWAMLASVSYGLTFYMLGFMVAPTFGHLLPVWIIRAVSIALLLAVALLFRRNLPRPDDSTTRFLLLVGVLDTAAYVATALGVGTDQVSVVTVLGSLFTAVTVVLSWMFLRERLQPNQWLGVGLIIASIVLVSV
jgi:drug/metabolite transporter (DMT)-like permease